MITQKYHIKGLGEIAYSDGTLVDNVKDLNGRLISPKDEAFARFQSRVGKQIGKTDGTRVAIEVDYLKDEDPVLVRYDKLSPRLAKSVVDANSHNKYFCTDSSKRYETKRRAADKQLEQGISPSQMSAIVISRNVFEMALTPSRDVLDFLFQDQTEVYYGFKGDFPIRFYPLDRDVVDGNNPDLLTNTNGTIVIPALWFCSLDYRSEFFGDRFLDFDIRARGVLKSGEATSQKISTQETKVEPAYTLKKLARNLGITQGVKEGRLPNSRLEQVIDFLEGLK